MTTNSMLTVSSNTRKNVRTDGSVVCFHDKHLLLALLVFVFVLVVLPPPHPMAPVITAGSGIRMNGK